MAKELSMQLQRINTTSIAFAVIEVLGTSPVARAGVAPSLETRCAKKAQSICAKFVDESFQISDETSGFIWLDETATRVFASTGSDDFGLDGFLLQRNRKEFSESGEMTVTEEQDSTQRNGYVLSTTSLSRRVDGTAEDHVVSTFQYEGGRQTNFSMKDWRTEGGVVQFEAMLNEASTYAPQEVTRTKTNQQTVSMGKATGALPWVLSVEKNSFTVDGKWIASSTTGSDGSVSEKKTLNLDSEGRAALLSIWTPLRGVDTYAFDWKNATITRTDQPYPAGGLPTVTRFAFKSMLPITLHEDARPCFANDYETMVCAFEAGPIYPVFFPASEDVTSIAFGGFDRDMTGRDPNAPMFQDAETQHQTTFTNITEGYTKYNGLIEQWCKTDNPDRKSCYQKFATSMGSLIHNETTETYRVYSRSSSGGWSVEEKRVRTSGSDTSEIRSVSDFNSQGLPTRIVKTIGSGPTLTQASMELVYDAGGSRLTDSIYKKEGLLFRKHFSYR